MYRLLIIALVFFSCSDQPEPTNTTISGSVEKKDTLKQKDISDPTNTLTGKIETLELDYIIWGCACANWIRPQDFKRYEDNDLASHCIFIEPANGQLVLPIYFEPYRHRIKVKGQVYTKPDYPKGTVAMEEPLDKAKVFRYTEMEVLDNPNFVSDSKTETLLLSYNAIACTCAQWSEAKYDGRGTEKRVRYWLEPANADLPDADGLFDGEHLPLQIKVTGKLISEHGFPKKRLEKVGEEEAGKVFRYTRIVVLKNGKK